jgi:hypothetical protein
MTLTSQGTKPTAWLVLFKLIVRHLITRFFYTWVLDVLLGHSYQWIYYPYRIDAVYQLHRVIRMGLEMACEIESILIDVFIMWLRWQENLRTTSARH